MKLAKVIRVITIPPVMVTALILVLWGTDREIFGSGRNAAVAILALGIFPVLAYLVWAMVPKLKAKGREGQRKLAFLFTIVGYALGWLYGHITHVPARLLLIFDSYLLSAAILLVLNFVFHIKASGHACSVTGPLALSIYFLGWISLAPCLVIEAASFWASLKTKRHTFAQLLAGTAVALAAFAAAILLQGAIRDFH